MATKKVLEYLDSQGCIKEIVLPSDFNNLTLSPIKTKKNEFSVEDLPRLLRLNCIVIERFYFVTLLSHLVAEDNQSKAAELLYATLNWDLEKAAKFVDEVFPRD